MESIFYVRTRERTLTFACKKTEEELDTIFYALEEATKKVRGVPADKKIPSLGKNPGRIKIQPLSKTHEEKPET